MAPTHSLRKGAPPPGGQAANRRAIPKARRGVLIKIGNIELTARLLDTMTARHIWYELPVWSTVERWGEGALHFETHVATGRERRAQWNVEPGQIAYWVEDSRVIIGYGPTPISLQGEIRLPAPANIWAETDDDVTALARIPTATRVDMTLLVL